jgi:cytochrome P450
MSRTLTRGEAPEEVEHMHTRLPVEQDISPFAWFRTRRESTPVFYDADAECWQVFRYDDVLRIATDHDTFSSEARRRLIAPEDEDMFLPSIISMDPPRHRQLRSLVTQAFTPRAVARLAPRIAIITNQLLDRVIATGTMDVINDLAYPLPVTVIAELLGIPAADRSRFKAWSDAVIVGDDDVGVEVEVADVIAKGHNNGRRAAARRAANEMRAYFVPLLAEHRRHPQDDLISSLLAAEVDGQRLTEDELLGFSVLLLVAGNITTTNLLGNAMVCFDEHPDALPSLRQEPELIPSAIEEVLRYRSPAKMIVRIAATDTTIADQSVARGDLIVAWIASANHDETRFPDPERLDVRREPNPHLAFGHGIHFCIGAPLARLEAKIALDVMLERLPHMTRVPGIPLEPLNTPVLSGIQHYHITFGDS